jgi:hypothetical protein
MGKELAENEAEHRFDSQSIEKLETVMQDKRPEQTADASLLSAWMEEIGGSVFIGQGKLKSVEISKSGDKLTLIIKKKSVKENEPIA